jgi:hypothetical protein
MDVSFPFHVRLARVKPSFGGDERAVAVSTSGCRRFSSLSIVVVDR